MKTMRWIVLTVIALGAVGWMLAQAGVSNRANGGSEEQDLRQQVDQLQARLKSLENRLAKLESAKPNITPKLRILPQPPGSPPSFLAPSLPNILGRNAQPPKVWGQREVNGWPVYVVPCGDR